LHLLSAGFEPEAGGESEDLEPRTMVWVETNACEMETDECWGNDGPHPVISFDSSGMNPMTMRVHILLDGRVLFSSGDPSGDASIIMRSPHEFPSHDARPRNAGQHIVEAHIVAHGEGHVLARDSVSFEFDLRQPALAAEERAGAGSCPVMEGSDVVFDYRSGDGHGTHQPVLRAAFDASSGPVIEFGSSFLHPQIRGIRGDH